MQTANMIPVDEFCIHHNIELSFIYSLQDSGLLQITRMEQKFFVTAGQLPQLEKIVRLYRDLDINLEGIETITYLLQKMNAMQQQITQLSNRLNLYENDRVDE